jgi:hypothetical protein
MAWKIIAISAFAVFLSFSFFSTEPWDGSASQSLSRRLHHSFSVLRWRYHTYFGRKFIPIENNGIKEWHFVIVADQDDRNIVHDT